MTPRRNCRCAVYPRVCGGTIDGLTPAQAAEGLSPRVRGNPTRVPGVPG